MVNHESYKEAKENLDAQRDFTREINPKPFTRNPKVNSIVAIRDLLKAEIDLLEMQMDLFENVPGEDKAMTKCLERFAKAKTDQLLINDVASVIDMTEVEAGKLLQSAMDGSKATFNVGTDNAFKHLKKQQTVTVAPAGAQPQPAHHAASKPSQAPPAPAAKSPFKPGSEAEQKAIIQQIRNGRRAFGGCSGCVL